jgi:dihydroneopterin aldolase
MIEVRTGFRKFEIYCVIGVYPQERNRKQLLYLDLEVSYNGTEGIQTDKEDKAVDYTQIATLVQRVCVDGEFGLLETLVYHCAQRILETFHLVHQVTVEVTKPFGLPGSSGSFAKITQVRK